MVNDKPHVIFPIDSDYKYPCSSSRHVMRSCSNPHLVAMGRDLNITRKVFSNGTVPKRDGYYELKSKGFNYSFCCNHVLRKLQSHRRLNNPVVGISDPTIYFNFDNVEKEIDGLDENSYLQLNVLLDSLNEPLDLSCDSIVIQSERKISEIITASEKDHGKRKKVPLKFYIPIIFTRLEVLTEIENGLDEFIFTDLSRNYLGYQLDKIGLKKIVSVNYAFKLSTEFPPRNSKRVKEDERVIEDRIRRTKHTVFIPSNFGKIIGNEKFVKYISEVKNSPVWSKEILQISNFPARLIPEVTPSIFMGMNAKKVDILTNDILPSDYIKSIRIEDSGPVEPLCSNDVSNVVMIIPNNIRDIIKSSVLLRELFENYGKVDIITDNKNEENITLLDTDFVGHIFDMNDIENGFVDLNKYKKIIKSKNFIGRTPRILDEKLKSANRINDVILAEDIDTKIDTLPFCNFFPYKKQISDDTIAFSGSMYKNLIRAKSAVRWDKYPLLISKFLNEKHPVSIVLHSNERCILDDINKLRRKRNVNIVINSSSRFISGYLRKVKCFITNPFTDLFWLSYGSGQKTITIVGPHKDKIPRTPNVHLIGKECTCKKGPERCPNNPCLSQLDLNEVYEEICEKL